MICPRQKLVVRAFLARPGMYIGEDLSKDKVEVFIHGMECMIARDECLSIHIDKLLYNKYKITGYALGWPNAVARYGTRNNISWFEAFTSLSNEVIDSDKENE